MLCRGMPWVIRCSILSATQPSLRVPTGVFAWQPSAFEPGLRHELSHEPSHESSFEPSLPRNCASFTGFAVPCAELRRIREFNREVMPTLRDSGYRVIRKAMNEHGFPGHPLQRQRHQGQQERPVEGLKDPPPPSSPGA